MRLALERVAAAEAEVSAHAETMARAIADSERNLTLAHEAERQGLVQAHEADRQGLAEQHRAQMQLLQSEVVRDTEKTQSQVEVQPVDIPLTIAI